MGDLGSKGKGGASFDPEQVLRGFKQAGRGVGSDSFTAEAAGVGRTFTVNSTGGVRTQQEYVGRGVHASNRRLISS